MERPNLRLLGKADHQGRLLTFREGVGRRDTKLTTITYAQIRDHLVMVYFLGISEDAAVSEAAAMALEFGLILRKSIDRLGRTYYWRVFSTAPRSSEALEGYDDPYSEIYPTCGDWTCIDGEWIHNDAWQHD
jgi:hypothetical protein